MITIDFAVDRVATQCILPAQGWMTGSDRPETSLGSEAWQGRYWQPNR
jgi:hypothetical protein